MDVVLLRGAELTAVARETCTCVALGSAPGALGPFSPSLNEVTSLVFAGQCPFRDKWYHSVLCAQIGPSVPKFH